MLTWILMKNAGEDGVMNLMIILSMLGDCLIVFLVACAIQGWPC